MGEPRLSKIIIGVLLVSLFSATFMLYASSGANEYDAPGYSNSSLQQYYILANQSSDIASETTNTLENTTAGSGSEFDIFGGFFARAWSSLKSTWQSITVIQELGDQAVGDLPLVNNQFRNALRVFIAGVVMVIIVIGIYFSFIRSSNRL